MTEQDLKDLAHDIVAAVKGLEDDDARERMVFEMLMLEFGDELD